MIKIEKIDYPNLTIEKILDMYSRFAGLKISKLTKEEQEFFHLVESLIPPNYFDQPIPMTHLWAAASHENLFYTIKKPDNSDT